MPVSDKKLRTLIGSLHADDRETLYAFAEFLVSRRGPVSELPREPLLVERPARESVVAAIRRLSTSYPMLDRSILLNQTSALMSQHVMEGRPAPSVIDDLEALFAEEFRKLSGLPGDNDA